MKRLVPCFVVIFIIAVLSTAAFCAEVRTVEAVLDGTCTTLNGAFTIGPGSSAGSFSATMSSPWRACSVDYLIDTIGFMIVDSNDKTYLTYVQHKDGGSQELVGSLSTLSLGPGTYNVYVQGGLDTKVRLTFSVMTEKLIFQ